MWVGVFLFADILFDHNKIAKAEDQAASCTISDEC